MSTLGSCRTLGSSGAASDACKPPLSQSLDTSNYLRVGDCPTECRTFLIPYQPEASPGKHTQR